MSGFIINRPVFFGAVGIIMVLLGVGTFLPQQADAFLTVVEKGILAQVGWFYLLAVGVFLASVVILCFSRFGDLKLGPDDCEPDFRFVSWVAMLFAAGKGIGLMYYAVAEPIMHFTTPPDAAPRSIAAQQDAMSITFFHWGIHAWSIYSVVGLSLAYFGYRYNLPLTIRSGLYPLLKHRIKGRIGDAVDIFAICCTVFGLATSLGLGVQQVNGGLNYLIGLPMSVPIQVLLIVIISAISTLAVLSGLSKGIKRMSELNILLAIGLMLFVLFAGPTIQLMRDLVQNIGLYLSSFVPRTFNVYAYKPTPWINDWTLFYWAWWMSWAPFVGMFIARISRGRTVREFILAVLLLPSAFTFLWMTVFGNTALFLDQGVAGGAISTAVAGNVSIALFKFFAYLPFSGATTALAIFMIGIFFISSQSSGSLVMDIIGSGGKTETTKMQRLFWCVLEALVTIILLVAGGLAALKAATIIAALPFAMVMLVLLAGLFKGMRADMAQYAVGGVLRTSPSVDPSWQTRLSQALHMPGKADVDSHLAGTVRPALAAVTAELTRRGRPAHMVERDGDICLVAPAGNGHRGFLYGVRPAERALAAFSPLETVDPQVRHEARTFFACGGRGYDIMGLTEEQVIADVLSQFERYLILSGSPMFSLLTRAPEHHGVGATA
ncbi:BCCT family transporter [Sphingomonadaceae bacterium jetA1]|jgi:choline/glycine/proline betaine transport protein|uniref:BCCT family transporter n=1 Tax=Facivitalis istanbulensis TaxID=3075838 RepID=UPI0034993402